MKTMEFTNEEFQTLREALESHIEHCLKTSKMTEAKEVHSLLSKMEALNEQFPGDYEACGECGFDHAYEHAEAQEAHEVLAKRVQESA